MSWMEIHSSCACRIEIAMPRRPANALCIEIMEPMPHCTSKIPAHWTGRGASALRWLASGGSPLVLGRCSPNCPRVKEEP